MKKLLIGLLSAMLPIAIWAAFVPIKPALPVTVATRDGLVGKVVNLTSNKKEGFTWEANVRVTTWTGKFKQSGHATMISGWSTDLGWMQGFDIESGDWVLITSKGYRGRWVWVW